MWEYVTAVCYGSSALGAVRREVMISCPNYNAKVLTRLLEALRGERSPTRIAGYDDDGRFVTLIARGDKLTYGRLKLIVDRWPELSWQDSRIRDTFSRIMTTKRIALRYDKDMQLKEVIV